MDEVTRGQTERSGLSSVLSQPRGLKFRLDWDALIISFHGRLLLYLKKKRYSLLTLSCLPCLYFCPCPCPCPCPSLCPDPDLDLDPDPDPDPCVGSCPALCCGSCACCGFGSCAGGCGCRSCGVKHNQRRR